MKKFFNIDGNLKELILVYEGLHRWKSFGKRVKKNAYFRTIPKGKCVFAFTRFFVPTLVKQNLAETKTHFSYTYFKIKSQ
jgi:hypothetical protein